MSWSVVLVSMTEVGWEVTAGILMCRIVVNEQATRTSGQNLI